MRSIRVPLLVASLALFASRTAYAQPQRAATGSTAREEVRGRTTPLKEMFGVAVAVRLAQSDDAAARLRGIERLGAIGTTEAIDALVEQIEQGSPASRD